MTEKPQSETERPVNTMDNQMVRGKCKKISNRNQDYLASSEPSSPTTASPEYPNTPEKQDSDYWEQKRGPWGKVGGKGA
jgi:hypothetical protein